MIKVLFSNDRIKASGLMLSVFLQIDFKTMILSLLEISKALEAKIRDTRDLEPRLRLIAKLAGQATTLNLGLNF